MKRTHYQLSTWILSLLLSMGTALTSCSKEDHSEEPVAETITLSINVLTVNQEEGTFSLSFFATSKWNASSDVQWITLDTTSGQAGNSSLTVQFSQNTLNEPRTGNITIRAGRVSNTIKVIQQNRILKLTGKWHLGWWVYGNKSIHFDGTEAITFNDDVLTWEGQQDPNGNGNYQLEYGKNYQSFKLTKSGSSAIFYIRLVRSDILVLQEGTDGPTRYWFTSKEAAKASEWSSLPGVSGGDEGEIPDPSHPEKSKIEDILLYKSGVTDSNKTPMGKHFEGSHQTTDEDIAWLLNPDNEPDYAYANENASAPTLTLWKNFTVNLYPFGSPEPADVNQHAIGDCCFCAVMASVAYLYPDFIKDMIQDNGNGTYTVKLYDPAGKRVEVCVKSTFLCEKNGNLAQVSGKNNAVTWSTVLEKAVMKYQTRYKVDRLWGIGTEFVAPILTGDGRSIGFSPNVLWNHELKLLAEWAVDEGMIGAGGFNKANLKCGTLYTIVAHAFTIMKTNASSQGYLFSMRNPWGIESVDGVLDIPDTREVCSTIDFRLVYPGAAKPFLRTNRGPYIPPVWTKSATDLGVSSRLLQLTRCTTVQPSPAYPSAE